MHSVIDTHLQWPEHTKEHNFKEVNWADFTRSLHGWLQDNGVTESPCLSMVEDLDTFIEKLTCTIQATIEQHVPLSNPSPYTKRWWTPELRDLRRCYARLSRTEFAARQSDGWEQARDSCRVARNIYNLRLRHTKATHWKGWVEELTEPDLWLLCPEPAVGW